MCLSHHAIFFLHCIIKRSNFFFFVMRVRLGLLRVEYLESTAHIGSQYSQLLYLFLAKIIARHKIIYLLILRCLSYLKKKILKTKSIIINIKIMYNSTKNNSLTVVVIFSAISSYYWVPRLLRFKLLDDPLFLFFFLVRPPFVVR